MREVVLQIPTLETEQNIEIDVRINGRKRTLKYRVEIVGFSDEDAPTEEKISFLRQVIKDHDQDWELIQIGAPIKNKIPITFRRRRDEEQGKYLVQR